MKKNFLLTIIMLTFLWAGSSAQSISRQVFCASGATFSNNAGTLTSTFGQCPGCGTLENNAGFLTQGFQQPSGNPCFDVSFTFEEMTGICGSAFNFTFTGDANINQAVYDWDFGDNAFPQTSEIANPQGVAYASAGMKTVTLKVSSPLCQKVFSLDIMVAETGFSTNPIVTDVGCKGNEDGSILLEYNSGTAPFSVIWSTSNESQLLSGLPSGDYTYTVTDATGCTTANTVTVGEPTDTASVVFATKDETCKGDLDGSVSVTVTGGTSPYDLKWSNGENGETIQGLGAGIYTLTVKDAKGCESSFSTLLKLQCKPDIVTTVTPNGDGINDVWIVDGIESFPDNEVMVYNRWGELVWGQKGYTNDWYGTNNSGKPLTVGAYYFVVYLHDAGKTVLTGSLTIVR